MRDRCESKVYTTTDHLVTHVTAEILGETIHFLYVSLDNSCRANTQGFCLNTRISEICKLVTNALQEKGDCIVCFSEACRPSFYGDEKSEKTTSTPWFWLREFIASKCDLHFLGEAKNNESVLSFGLAMFCTPDLVSFIHDVRTERLLTEGFGSVALGVQLYDKDGPILWGVHFPLDFNQDFDVNKNLVTLRALCKLLKQSKSCAIGDFNTIPG